MNPLIKGGIAFGALAGVSGAGYAIHNIMQQKTKEPSYGDLFKDTLLNTTNDSHKTNWQKRLATLKLDLKLVDELIPLKTKSTENLWEELKKWCKYNIDKPNKGEQNREFKNIQNYCTFSIKEKIKDFVDDVTTGGDNSKWATAISKLEAIDDSELEADLIKTKKEKNKEEIKKWCNNVYDKPYKGINDKDFRNASRICLSK